MQFCKQCGTPIAILHDKDAIFCTTCAPAGKTTRPQKNENNVFADLAFLSDCTLSVENNKVLLTSKEGWLLWSGNSSSTHNLQILLKKAAKIYGIRKRQE